MWVVLELGAMKGYKVGIGIGFKVWVKIPGSRVIRMVRFPGFPASQIIRMVRFPRNALLLLLFGSDPLV